ncbi:MAG: V-type ATPase subunit [Victivallales bacterium]
MVQSGTGDLDFVNALLHGRRSRLHEGSRLDDACRLRTAAELSREFAGRSETSSFSRLQRLILEELTAELNSLRCHLAGGSLLLYEWGLVRFQLEQLKAIIRGFIARSPVHVIRDHLINLPKELTLNTDRLLAAESLTKYPGLLPSSGLRDVAENVLSANHAKLFLLEAALDHEYFREMLARAGRISPSDLSAFNPLIIQEVDIFHLLLVARGKFIYGFNSDQLLPLHVSGSGISQTLFKEMLSDPEPVTIAKRVVNRAIDSVPQNQTTSASMLEELAWNRYYRLSCQSFRRSILGPGMIFSYAGIRRIEVANLITIIEGVRLGMPADKIRSRLLPRTEREEAHV